MSNNLQQCLYKNPKDYYGFTLLHYAAGPVGFLDICDFTINIVEKNSTDKLGNTTLHFAAKKWAFIDITKLIIEKVEKIENRNPKKLLSGNPT